MTKPTTRRSGGSAPMAKPTMRRSGERCVTLRVRQDLSLMELAHIFWRASTSGYKVESDGFPRNSTDAVRDVVDSRLRDSGRESYAYDDEEFIGSAEAQRWAFEHVARAYGFDESEIPEPVVDEGAARRLVRMEAGKDPDGCDDD